MSTLELEAKNLNQSNIATPRKMNQITNMMG